MFMEEARAEVAKLADGRAFTIMLHELNFGSGKVETTRSVWIMDDSVTEIHSSLDTWQDAIASLRAEFEAAS